MTASSEIDSLVSELLSIIRGEVKKIKSGQFDKLIDSSVSSNAINYLRAMVALKREARQAHLDESLDSLDQEEFDKLTRQAIALLNKKDENKGPDNKPSKRAPEEPKP